MRKMVAGLFVALLVVMSSQALAGGRFHRVGDVVVVFCQRSDGISGSVFASHASSSTDAPLVAVGTDTNCAEELANLTGAGFRIQSVVPADDSFVVYTMTRR